VVILQVWLFLVSSDDSAIFQGLFCVVIFPLLAWLVGFLTVGWIYAPTPGQPPVNRTPRLGLAICLVPDLLLCVWAGVAFLLHH
jgi:hypothetical protein